MTARKATGITMISVGFGAIFAAVAVAHGIVPTLIAFAMSAVLTALIIGGIKLSV